MGLPYIHEIDYQPDTSIYFAQLYSLKHPIWLDSCRSPEGRGRYDILAACPTHYLQTYADRTLIETFNSAQSLPGRDTSASEQREDYTDPFTLIARYLPPAPESLASQNPLPICGGAIGFWGYDLARRLEEIPQKLPPDSWLPDMAIGIYPWTLVVDHREQKAFISAIDERAGMAISRHLSDRKKLKSILEKELKPFKINKFKNTINASSYFEKFDTIQRHIRDGDCYQVNFAQRFCAQCEGDPLLAYRHLRQINPAPFAGFIPLEHGAILSLSPERFISAEGSKVTTCPIKGTMARGKTKEEDALAARQLLNSRKDQAENLMIVDLLRNDLSRSCRKVRVPRLFELQSFTNVHHLVSTIEAELKPGQTPLQLLRAAFPGGSITGAPKLRAMAIIEALESHRRGPYCGSLGYVSNCGNMDTSIAIRTLVVEEQHISCWGGGGIVADSQAESEYQESITKVALLLNSLEKAFGKD